MSVGLGLSDDLLKKKLSELGVQVEQQMNNVLITLCLRTANVNQYAQFMTIKANV